MVELFHSPQRFFVAETFTEVKVVIVFDALMSGLPTHKESFEGYYFYELKFLDSFILFFFASTFLFNFSECPSV